jgi:protein-S-isoprenylcysteine O-methyltransferase Ste14
MSDLPPSPNAPPQTAAVIAPPPLILLAAAALGFVFESFAPASFSAFAQPSTLRAAGLALIALALLLGGLAAWQFRRARTALEPWKPSTALVTSGIFRFSRNPIYLGFLLVLVGLGLFRDSPWIVAMAAPLWAVYRVGVIAREEAYLARLFGEEYRAYCARTRRWL